MSNRAKHYLTPNGDTIGIVGAREHNLKNLSVSIPRDKFVVKGNGPDKPVASNSTPEGKAKNRRTDFEIVPQS